MLQKATGGSHKGSEEYEAFKVYISQTVFGKKDMTGETARNMMRLFNDEDYLRPEGEVMIRQWIKIVTDLSYFDFLGLESQKKRIEALRNGGDFKALVCSFVSISTISTAIFYEFVYICHAVRYP